jgi:hypothetical protein
VLPEIEQELSVRKKPEPVTATVIPTTPELGVSVIEGPATTVNVVSAKSPVLPVKRTL